jgi:hypothetical protein
MAVFGRVLELWQDGRRRGMREMEEGDGGEETHAGTAGEISLFSSAAGAGKSGTSVSSLEMILREAMMND